MPILDGIEATRLLKAGAATRHVPVIAHTAKPDVVEETSARPFAHVWPRPSLPSQLVASVRAFLGDHHRLRLDGQNPDAIRNRVKLDRELNESGPG